MRNFYPRPPRGGRLRPSRSTGSSWSFLSTPSARRATSRPARSTPTSTHFYPRPPRGGRRVQRVQPRCSGLDFYPRPPRGGRRELMRSNLISIRISIHALREEGDALVRAFALRSMEFLSTPSARRATRFVCAGRDPPADFYPRPPRGGRLHHNGRRLQLADFYPRPPRGGRPSAAAYVQSSSSISIHALREEGDLSRRIYKEV